MTVNLANNADQPDDLFVRKDDHLFAVGTEIDFM
jgi:hypothetical protein